MTMMAIEAGAWFLPFNDFGAEHRVDWGRFSGRAMLTAILWAIMEMKPTTRIEMKAVVVRNREVAVGSEIRATRAKMRLQMVVEMKTKMRVEMRAKMSVDIVVAIVQRCDL